MGRVDVDQTRANETRVFQGGADGTAVTGVVSRQVT